MNEIFGFGFQLCVAVVLVGGWHFNEVLKTGGHRRGELLEPERKGGGLVGGTGGQDIFAFN